MERAALDAYLDWLRENGVSFSVAPALHREPDHDGQLIRGDSNTTTHPFPNHEAIAEHRDVAHGFAADHATDTVLGALARNGLVRVGEAAWDIGCGTGVLASGAALLGASPVVATDVAEEALALARRTIQGARVNVELRAGSLLDPMSKGERADLIVANLPHKPVPSGLGIYIAQDGGEDGASLHLRFLQQALRHLSPGGRMVFFLHSLPDPRLLRAYGEAGALTLVAWKRRWLQGGEYGSLADHFRQRHREGSSWMGEAGNRRFMLAGAWVLEIAAGA